MRLLLGVVAVVGTMQLGSVNPQRAVRPTFQVASVKRSSPDVTPATRSVIGEVAPGGVWRAKGATVYGLIRTLYPGYSLPGQIQGVSNWVGGEFYDVEARATPSASPDEMREMARTLLADRFKLRMHTEKREMPVYGLVMARKDGRLGAGLMKPAIDCDAYRLAQQHGDPLPTDPTRKKFGDRSPCATVLMSVVDSTRLIPGAQVRISAGSARIRDIVELVSRELGRPVLDKTGLMELFDIEVQFSITPVVDGDSGPPLRAALADQLGLRVEESRAATDIIVIDQVDRPDPN